MDALTSAGLELFNQLRQLRFDTAQREGLPPYVVFGDKSLVDMCLRAPRRVMIVAALPTTPQGKFDLRRLAEMATGSETKPSRR